MSAYVSGDLDLVNNSIIEHGMLDVKLVVVGGAKEGEVYPLPKLPATLGRSRENTIPLPHPLVSRRHCELFERDGELLVRDLASTNGTFVGSERVEQAILDHAGLLTIGTVTFRACYAGMPIPLGDPHLPLVDEDPVVADTSTITRTDGAGSVAGTTVRPEQVP